MNEMNNFNLILMLIISAECVLLGGCSINELRSGKTSKGNRTIQPKMKKSLAQPLLTNGFTEANKLSTSLISTTIDFTEIIHDFGNIAEGEIVEHVFAFTNTGKKPLMVLDVQTTCGCTVPDKPEEPVLPKKTGEIKVRFHSQGKSGVVSKAVDIITNTEPATTRLFIKANIISENNTTASNN